VYLVGTVRNHGLLFVCVCDYLRPFDVLNALCAPLPFDVIVVVFILLVFRFAIVYRFTRGFPWAAMMSYNVCGS
jgi:hypothetical protein